MPAAVVLACGHEGRKRRVGDLRWRGHAIVGVGSIRIRDVWLEIGRLGRSCIDGLVGLGSKEWFKAGGWEVRGGGYVSSPR